MSAGALTVNNALHEVVDALLDSPLRLLSAVLYAVVVWWGIVDLKTAIALGGAKYIFKLVIALIDTGFLYWAKRAYGARHRAELIPS